MLDPCHLPARLQPCVSRRAALAGGGALFAWSFLPRLASAATARDSRFVVVILRGALDGMSAVAPVGDPDYVGLRESIALTTSGDHSALPLDGFFALHPAMTNFARLYRQGHATVVHACATSYRERSHFDGQDMLESGQPHVGPVDTGWLNRALTVLPKAERVSTGGLGVGLVTPLVLRGPAPVLGWAPPVIPRADDNVAARVLDLYTHTDPLLADMLTKGLDTDRLAAKAGMGNEKARGGAEGMKAIAAGAARLLAQDVGPRVAALAFDGWDTHANEGAAIGPLAQLLGGLDGALAAFEEGLAERWKDTVIVVATEFGRTAKVNGTVGTDHGTGTAAFLAGGAVKGGRVIADWPGLKEAQLHEKRDLKPTTDLRAVFKGVLADHLGLPPGLVASKVFPDSAKVAPMNGLIG